MARGGARRGARRQHAARARLLQVRLYTRSLSDFSAYQAQTTLQECANSGILCAEAVCLEARPARKTKTVDPREPHQSTDLIDSLISLIDIINQQIKITWLIWLFWLDEWLTTLIKLIRLIRFYWFHFTQCQASATKFVSESSNKSAQSKTCREESNSVIDPIDKRTKRSIIDFLI